MELSVTLTCAQPFGADRFPGQWPGTLGFRGCEALESTNLEMIPHQHQPIRSQ